MNRFGVFRVAMLLFVTMFTVSVYAQNGETYVVKKKDTVYGIARKFGLTIEQLTDANPGLDAEGTQLKKGMTIVIPRSSTGSPVTANASSASQIEKKGSMKVGVMLPLHDNDGDGRRMTEYYRGILMACENLKREGISVDIRAWNVDIDSDIRVSLLDEGTKDRDIIFGPLYTKQVRPLADFCRSNGIKLVIPFSINADDVEKNEYVFQVYQSPLQFSQQSVKAFIERSSGSHVVIVDCNDSTSKKGVFTKELRAQLDKNSSKYNLTSITSTDEQFAKAFVLGMDNIVVLNSSKSEYIRTFIERIEVLRSVNPTLSVTLFGYTEWLMFAKQMKQLFHRYNVYIPTSFYYNESSETSQQLARKYKATFGRDMIYALPYFALTGYDHAQYFLRGINKFGDSFQGDKNQKAYNAVQTPLVFQPLSDKSGRQNVEFMLIHYTKEGGIDALSY